MKRLAARAGLSLETMVAIVSGAAACSTGLGRGLGF